MSDPSLERENDLLLVEGLKGGKKECYEALYNRYIGPMYRFIYYMVHQKEAAEDLTQEVFIKLYHSAHLFDSKKGSFSTWLHQMAKNLTLNYIRREKFIQPQTLVPDPADTSELLTKIENVLKDERIQPDEAAVTKEQFELLERMLLRLSERDRQLIILCIIREYPQHEVANILNCSKLSVRVGLHRARERLMKMMGIDLNKLSES